MEIPGKFSHCSETEKNCHDYRSSTYAEKSLKRTLLRAEREREKIIILRIDNTTHCLHVGNVPAHENLEGKDEEEYMIRNIVSTTCDESNVGEHV